MNGFSAGNRLIQRLELDDQEVLLAQCVPVDFPHGFVFFEPGDTIDQIHFIESGVASSVAVLEGGRTVETVMIGAEGLTGAAAAMVPHQATTRNTAQVAGRAQRIEAARLRWICSERRGVREAIAGFAGRLQGELEQSAACNALHRAEQRFSKWLLRCHDRVDGDSFNLTQEQLAAMLGSQRTTVNEAAQGLQKAGAIAYSRGHIRVLDRGSLERFACECYRATASVRDDRQA
jgi:CRP-like cAMP-binding protein